jgi:hypothetical protein
MTEWKMAVKTSAIIQALDQLVVVLKITVSHSYAHRALASEYLLAAQNYRLALKKPRLLNRSRFEEILSGRDIDVINAILNHSQMAERYALHQDWEEALTHSYQALSALPGDEVSIPIRIPRPPW